MAAIEQVRKEVIEVFREVHGIDVINAWPIGLTAWQAEGTDGQVYTLRW